MSSGNGITTGHHLFAIGGWNGAIELFQFPSAMDMVVGTTADKQKLIHYIIGQSGKALQKRRLGAGS